MCEWAGLARELGAADIVLRASGSDPVEEVAATLEVEGDSDAHKVIEMGFVAHRPVTLRLPLPVEDIRGSSKSSGEKGGSWWLKFAVKEDRSGPHGPCRISEP